MREEARAAAEKEPLLVSFVYSTILNQNSLEAAVAFHLANKVGPSFPASFLVNFFIQVSVLKKKSRWCYSGGDVSAFANKAGLSLCGYRF